MPRQRCIDLLSSFFFFVRLGVGSATIGFASWSDRGASDSGLQYFCAPQFIPIHIPLVILHTSFLKWKLQILHIIMYTNSRCHSNLLYKENGKLSLLRLINHYQFMRKEFSGICVFSFNVDLFFSNIWSGSLKIIAHGFWHGNFLQCSNIFYILEAP